jgi:hypothetical protein
MDFVKTNLNTYANMSDIELIVVDSSENKEYEFTSNFGSYYYCESNSRAARINLGVARAKGEWVILHHPRSILGPEALAEFRAKESKLSWGGFTHKFDFSHPLLKFTSWYSNFVRGPRGIIYLDHCIFCKKSDYKKMKALPEVDIFEDTIISQNLFELLGKPQILKSISLTSAIRFKTNGVFKQAILNQYMKYLFYKNSDHENMNKIYEKKTKLNSNYKE